MAAKRHRNLFRESIDAHARKRSEAGLAPLTHAEWKTYFDGKRPTIGGQRVRKVAESSISRALSGTPGVARRIGADRAWILTVLGIDYTTYIAAWGNGPEGDAAEIGRRRGNTGARRKAEAGDRTDSGRPAVEGKEGGVDAGSV